MLVILIIACIIALDQITKFIVISTMTEHQSVSFINGLMNLTYRKNTGVAFGMLSDMRWLYMAFTAIMLVVMVWFLIKYRDKHKLLLISIAFLTGGGLGNMIDRLFRMDVDGSKFVVDFFEFTFVDFAIFNVADCFITFGAILLVIFVLFFDKNNPVFEKKSKIIADIDTIEDSNPEQEYSKQDNDETDNTETDK